MLFLYICFIRLYVFVLYLLRPFHPKARLWVEGRRNGLKGLEQALSKRVATQRFWVHCASLGEFEQGRPIIDALRLQYPDAFILLTFFSPSGYEIRKTYAQVDHVMYLPSDTPSKCQSFLKLLQPTAVIFVKYEFWWNMIRAIAQAQVPLYFVAVNFRATQHFFKSYGAWFRTQLKQVTHFFVQNETSKQLLQSIGIHQVTVHGDPRFDRVLQNKISAKHLPQVEAWCAGQPTLVAGSTWATDETLLLEALSSFEGKVILVPHEVDEPHIQSLIQKLKVPYERYSNCTETIQKSTQILVVDTIGHLSALYRYAHVSYVGGGFDKGIHNTLEAIAFGAPVVFGPRYSKFEEAKALLNEGLAKSASNATELKEHLHMFLKTHQDHAPQIEHFLMQHQGATEVFMNFLKQRNK